MRRIKVESETFHYLQNCKNYHDNWLLGDYECYKDYTLYANVPYYFENMPSLNTIYSGYNLENLQVMHVDANPSATYNIQDKNDIGEKWLEIIKKFIDNL